MNRLLLSTSISALVAIAGSAIAEDAGSVHTMVLEAQTHATNVIGLVPEGLRLDAHVTAGFTDGPLAGATGESIDYLLLRHDGVGVVYVRGYLVDPDGVSVAMTIRGFVGAPQPGLVEAMLDPEYEMPDEEWPVHGAVWFESMAPQYAFLNHTVFAATGTVNPGTGVVRYVFRSLAE